jgi:hypothetical protein
MNESAVRERTLSTVGVICLVIGPLSLIAATMLQWTPQPDPSSALFSVVAFISVFGPLIWLFGMPAAVNLAHDRGWGLTFTGGLLTAIGLAAGVGHLALFFGAPGAHEDNADGTALLVIFLVGFAAGPIVLTIGLRRAKTVAVWVPVAAVVMAVANFVGGVPAGIVELIALVATFAPIIVAALRPARSAVPALAN